MTDLHKDADGDDLHKPFRIQPTDPGAIGPHKVWGDDTDGLANLVLKLRNDADGGWITLLGIGTNATGGDGDPALGGDLSGTASAATLSGTAAALNPTSTAIASGTSMAHDCASKRVNAISINTLQHNGTLTLSNLPDGGMVRVFVKQDGTGSRTLTFAHAGLTVVTSGSLNAAAGARSAATVWREGSELVVTYGGSYA